jgi:hypothetical protein
MAKLDFYTIDKAEKAAIFNAIAAELGRTTAWLKLMDMVSQGNINVNQLLTNLMKDFYKNAKATSMLHPEIICLELCMADNRLLSLLVGTKNTYFFQKQIGL